ncbi:MAG: 50S ribosomal protein L29 [Rhodothermales bacterium]
MKIDEIRELTDPQIRERMKELREELFKLRFRSATMELENPGLLQTIRKDIARMNTILRERELGMEQSSVSS